MYSGVKAKNDYRGATLIWQLMGDKNLTILTGWLVSRDSLNGEIRGNLKTVIPGPRSPTTDQVHRLPYGPPLRTTLK